MFYGNIYVDYRPSWRWTDELFRNVGDRLRDYMSSQHEVQDQQIVGMTGYVAHMRVKEHILNIVWNFWKKEMKWENNM
jgi:hypothetical protein